MNDPEVAADPFAHLTQRAAARADRTVERLRAGIAALQATDQKITAESLKHVTRDLEPGFAGLSFQVTGETHAPTNHRRPTTTAASDVLDVRVEEHRTLLMIRCSNWTNGTWCAGSGRWRRNWKRSASAEVRWPTISKRCAPSCSASRREII